MIYKLTFRGSGDYGPVYPGKLRRWDKNEGLTANRTTLHGFKSVTILVHGFNVDELDSETSLSTLAQQLPSSNEEAIVFVLWPGDSPVGALSYPFTEGNQAIDTATELYRSILSHIAYGTNINFVAHSLGCRVVLETINNLYRSGQLKPNSYNVNQVCLMAAAVDDYCISIPTQYKAAVKKVTRVAVLSSLEDNVLKFIYPIGDLIQSFIYFWKETAGMAMGYHGPVTYYESDGFDDDDDEVIEHKNPDNVKHVAIPDTNNVDHGDYLPSPRMNDKQKKASKFSYAVITGEEELEY